MTRRLRPTQQRLCGFILQARISLKALDELFGDSTLSAAPRAELKPVDRSTVAARAKRLIRSLTSRRKMST